MMRNIQVGDKVHHEGRKHPEKDGWLQANGQILNILFDEDEDSEGEPLEIMVEFGDNDFEFYLADQLEWTDDLGGYWRVT